MKPFAKLDNHMTERDRYIGAIWNAWYCGVLTGLGFGGVTLSVALIYVSPPGWGIAVGVTAWVGLVAGVMLSGKSRRFLMRYAPGGDAQAATQTLPNERPHRDRE